jgi:ferrous-iron efflux pump FieF
MMTTKSSGKKNSTQTPQDRTDSAQLRATLMKRSSYASVAVAVLLISIKLAAWLYIGSVALLGSLVDSTLDLLASLATLIAIRQAVEPADKEHRFGHGKVEAIAGIGQSAIIMLSAVFLLEQSVSRLITPEVISHGLVGIGVLVASIFLTIFLVRYQMSVARRTGSLAVTADSFHYRSDLVMNLAVITAIGLTEYFGLVYADPLFGLGIAAYIGISAFGIARQAYDMLMDREMPEEDRLRIKTIAMAQGQVKNLHDLRTRQSGFNQFIQLHIELDAELKLRDAHTICDAVEVDIQKAYPDAEILIHADPAGLEAPHQGIGAKV